jgi:hypothetical protein
MWGAWYAWIIEMGRDELRFLVCPLFANESFSSQVGDADLEGVSE